MASNYAVEARFPSLTLDTKGAFGSVCRALCGEVNSPVHLPVSMEGSALDCLRFITPADTATKVLDAIHKGGTLTLSFATPGIVMEWIEAMEAANFTCDWGPPSLFKLYWMMRKGQSSVRLVVSGSGTVCTALSKAQTSEFLLTESRLTYKVQVAGEDIAEATKPSYLHTQHGHRPACWYYVDVDETATVVYKM